MLEIKIRASIVKVDKIIFVSVGKDGKSIPHYKVDDYTLRILTIRIDKKNQLLNKSLK
jgi:hypothetical protein